MTMLPQWPAKPAQTIAGDADLDPSALVDGRVLVRDATAHTFKGVAQSALSVDTSAVSDVRVSNESLNIMEPRFGADPADATGATNRAAILAAVAYAQGAARARIVVPEHSFLVDQLLVFDHDDLSLEGVDQGLSRIVLAPGSSGGGVLRFNPAAQDGTSYRSRCRLRNLAVDQQGLLQANSGTGYNNAVVFHQINDGEVENFSLYNARNGGLGLRIGSRIKVHGKNKIDTVINGGLGANAINLGGVTNSDGGPSMNYASLEGFDIIGSNTRLADGVITAGVLTSPSHNFDASDIGKQLIVHLPSAVVANISIQAASLNGAGGVTVLGAGVNNAGPVTFSFGFIDVACWLGPNMTRALVERFNIEGGCNSGIVAEGVSGMGHARYVDMTEGYVENARNIAFGHGDAGGGDTTLKHEYGHMAQLTAINPQKGLAAIGNGYKVTDYTCRGFYGNGLLLGGGNYNEVDLQVKGFTIEADPTASGPGLLAQKASTTVSTRDMEIGPGRLFGNGANVAGVQLAGNINDANFVAVRSSHWGKSGYIHTSSGGAGPSEINYLKCRAKNNGRSLTGVSTEQNGWDVGAGDSVYFDDCRGYDDQTITATVTNGSPNITVTALPAQGFYPKNGTPITGTGIPASTTVLSGGGTANLVLSANATAGDGVTPVTLTAKTQQFALHWITATRGRFRKNDFRGNAQGAKSVAFDSLTVYEGGGNIEKDDAHQGAATISNGASQVVTTAAAHTGAMILVVGRGVQHTSIAINSNVSFTINGPNGTYDWRIL